MASDKHIDILKQGVSNWNEWRKVHPKIMPDLRKANLCKMNLRSIDFRDTDLDMADLREADLCEADFTESRLS